MRHLRTKLTQFANCSRTPAPSSLGVLALYLIEADFVSLHACYLFPASLRRLAAHPVGLFLTGTHGFFALPECYPKQLATLVVRKGDHPLEPVQLLSLGHDPL